MRHPLLVGYRVTSELDAQFQEALIEILYFNDNQSRIRGALRSAVERYGTPQIRRIGQQLSLELSSIPQVQALYLLTDSLFPELAGVVVYAREESVLRVLYVGLAEEHAYGGKGQDYVLLMLFDVVRDIGRRIRGVEAVVFASGSRDLRIVLDRGVSAQAPRDGTPSVESP